MRQESFSRLWDGYETDKLSLQARNVRLRALRKHGFMVQGWTLVNQIKPYDGLGIANGRSCNVYMINVYDDTK